MALEQKLGVRMSQRLVMTPSLQQAIKLLQMSKLELVEEVQQELVENPVLEESQVDDASRRVGPESANRRVTRSASDPFDEIDFDSYFQDVEGYRPTPGERGRPELPTFENTLAETTSLADHLVWQLDLSTRPTTQTRRSVAPSSATSARRLPARDPGRDPADGPVRARSRSSARCAWSRVSTRSASPRAISSSVSAFS